MLREALAQRTKNIRVSRKIGEGKDFREFLSDTIESDVQLQLDSRWWLEKFFDKHNLSFVRGAILIYALMEVPRLFFLLLMLGRAHESFVTPFISTFLGDMFIPFALLLIHSIYKSLVKLKEHTNRTLRREQFVAPPISISERELTSSDSLAKLDRDYRNRYVKPVMLRTLQQGLELSFNKSYMLGFGIIAAGIFLLFWILRFVLELLPKILIVIAEPGIPEITIPYLVWFFAMITFDWFIIGMVSWTLFLTFMISIQASGNAMKIRPFESTKKYFDPTTDLILKIAFTLTFLTTWFSPLILTWSVFPADPMVRQNALMFVESILVVMIPVIILSFLIPILKTHKGMSESRERVLILKKHQLEDIKKFRDTNPDRYLKIQAHLVQDYKDIQSKPVWLLNLPQMLELMGTVLLPIVTFLISVTV